MFSAGYTIRRLKKGASCEYGQMVTADMLETRWWLLAWYWLIDIPLRLKLWTLGRKLP